MDNKGHKDDAEKPKLHLVPQGSVLAVARVMAYGAKRYGRGNWERGMDWTRLYDAGMRHMMAWMAGEDNDPETGLSHMDHAASCSLMLSEYVRSGMGTDDRRLGEVKPSTGTDAVPTCTRSILIPISHWGAMISTERARNYGLIVGPNNYHHRCTLGVNMPVAETRISGDTVYYLVRDPGLGARLVKVAHSKWSLKLTGRLECVYGSHLSYAGISEWFGDVGPGSDVHAAMINNDIIYLLEKKAS